MTALNAGMADTKPDFKPELEQRRSSSRLTIGLAALAGGLAVALLVACIGGGLYIGQLEQTIQSQQNTLDDTKTYKTSSGGNTYHITYKKGDNIESEDVTINTETETEMFTNKDEDGDITSIAVADFNKGIMAMYIPKTEECYMASGVHSWMSNASASIQDYEKEDGKEIVDDNGNADRVNFVVASYTPIKDHSVLPVDIRPFCADKHLYWMHKTAEEPYDEHSTDVSTETRHKRGVCYIWWCYYVYYVGTRRTCCGWVIGGGYYC